MPAADEEPPNDQPSCILICQVGSLSAEAPDEAVGSYARAMMDFEHLLQSTLHKHGARLAASSVSDEHHTIIAGRDVEKSQQLYILHQVCSRTCV